jgi:hypothetical protein
VIDWRSLPERPPSEVEWEELLVKLDIAPRALRAAVEDAPPGAALARTLMLAARREGWFGECLERLRAGEPVSLNVFFDVRVIDPAGAAQEALERYRRLRERNFSQLQRRGLEVWEWRSAEPDAITAYQLAQLMAWCDGETLRALRSVGAPA